MGVHEQRNPNWSQSLTKKAQAGETRKFIDNSFRDGTLKTTGTDIDKIMPPVSHFGGGQDDQEKVSLANEVFEKYLVWYNFYLFNIALLGNKSVFYEPRK